MSREGLSIAYFGDTDTLALRFAESPGCGETVAPDLWVMYGRDGEVSKITIEHAAKLLGPYLFPPGDRGGNGSGSDRGLAITYTPETDTLRLQTGEPPYAGFTEKSVGPGLTANFDPDGWAMGVTIEGAAELLRPYLMAEGAGIA